MPFVEPFNGSNKAVAEFRHSFYEQGNFGGILEYFTEPLDDGIEAGVEIHKSIGRPNGEAEFFAGDRLAGVLKEFEQHNEELLLEFDADTTLTQFVRAGINFKCAEAVHGSNLIRYL